MNTDTQTLKRLIEQSVLIKDERKTSLLNLLPTLDEAGIAALHELLLTEPAGIEELSSRVITNLVERGDQTELKELDTFLKDAGKTLRSSSEDIQRQDDAANADSLLDAA